MKLQALRFCDGDNLSSIVENIETNPLLLKLLTSFIIFNKCVITLHYSNLSNKFFVASLVTTYKHDIFIGLALKLLRLLLCLSILSLKT